MPDVGALAELLGATTYTETPLADGGVRVRLEFEPGYAKFDWYADRVYWQSVRSGSDLPTGLYTLFCARCPAFFRARGVQRFESSLTAPVPEYVLSQGSWQVDAGGHMTWVL